MSNNRIKNCISSEHGRRKDFFQGAVAVDCIALNYWGKHKRKIFFLFWFSARFLLCCKQKISVEELARKIEVDDDDHSLFMAVRIGIVAYNVWRKTFEFIFQITRGQW